MIEKTKQETEWEKRQIELDQKLKVYNSLLEPARGGDLPLLKKRLDEGADPDANPWYDTVLHWAAWNDKLDVLLELLAHGASPDFKAKHDVTPLHDAAQRGWSRIVTALLDHGADPNVRNKFGLRPLHFAAMNGHTHIYDILLAQGADLHATDDGGHTALHSAASFAAYAKAAKPLLARGLDPNAASQDGDRPLHFAANDASPAFIRALLAAGADVRAKDRKGRTALQIASRHNDNPKVAELLREASKSQRASSRKWTATVGKQIPPRSPDRAK